MRDRDGDSDGDSGARDEGPCRQRAGPKANSPATAPMGPPDPAPRRVTKPWPAPVAMSYDDAACPARPARSGAAVRGAFLEAAPGPLAKGARLQAWHSRRVVGKAWYRVQGRRTDYDPCVPMPDRGGVRRHGLGHGLGHGFWSWSRTGATAMGRASPISRMAYGRRTHGGRPGRNRRSTIRVLGSRFTFMTPSRAESLSRRKPSLHSRRRW